MFTEPLAVASGLRRQQPLVDLCSLSLWERVGVRVYSTA